MPARSPPSPSCTITGKRSMWCRATWWSATIARARADSNASRRPTPAGRRACTTVPSPRAAAASSTRSITTVLRTGSEHLRRLRDGRVVYIGSEKVDDVTTHAAFRNAARSIARIYDEKAAHAFTEGGEKFSDYFLRARTKDDLQ